MRGRDTCWHVPTTLIAPQVQQESAGAQQLLLGGSRRSMGTQGPSGGGHDVAGFLHSLGWAGVAGVPSASRQRACLTRMAVLLSLTDHQLPWSISTEQGSFSNFPICFSMPC